MPTKLNVTKQNTFTLEDLLTCLQKAYRSSVPIQLVNCKRFQHFCPFYFHKLEPDELDEIDRIDIFKTIATGRLEADDLNLVMIDLCNKGLVEPGNYSLVYTKPKSKTQRR